VKLFPLFLTVVAVLGIMAGCERDLPFVAPTDNPITGYRIEGYVTDHLGVPLKGIQVALWYDYEFVDTLRPPSTTFFVDDPTKAARIRVLDRNQIVIATVFDGLAPSGIMDLEWDKRDAFGNLAPSGVYTVEFSVGGVSRASYIVVIDGAVTAVTDSLGHYSIPDLRLPIGFYPVPRYSSPDSHFLGNYSITPLVGLELYLEAPRGASLTLTKDQVTRRDFVI
jgi:hypothetical protein